MMEESSILPLRWLGGLITWFGELFIYHKAGIVIAQFLTTVGYAVRTIKASFDSLDYRTEDVALTLGCTRAQAFWRVTLPGARAGIAAGAILSWARAIGIFGPVMIIAGAVRGKTEVLPTSIYLEISIGEVEVALAISFVMIALSLMALLLFRRFTRHLVVGGATGM